MMDLSTWRAQQANPEAFDTPSGLTIQVKRVSLLDLAAQGSIPEPLAGAANEFLTARVVPLDSATAKEYEKVLDLVVRACVVSPPIADEPGDGVLGIDEFNMDDKLAIYRWANGVIAKLRPFREETKQSDPSVSDGEIV